MFLSHSHNDAAWVERLARRLEDEAGFKVWLDRWVLVPGEPWIPPMAQGLDQAGREAPVVGCDEALAALAGLGLLRWEGADAGPVIHPLLGEFAREVARQGQDDGEADEVLRSVVKALVEPAREANAEMDRTGRADAFKPLLPHARSVAEHGEQAAVEQAGALSNSLGYHVHAIADYAGARAAYERALAILKRFLPAGHPNIRITEENLAGLGERRGG